MPKFKNLKRLSLPALLLITATALGQAAPDFKPGDKIEVREGDVWSAATFQKKEGRRLQIKYDTGEEEWVTADRIRKAGGAAPEAKGTTPAPDNKGATPPAGGNAPAATPPKPKPVSFEVGQVVEIKDNATWREVKILNKRSSGWYLVEYTSFFKGSKEWVEPWRIRKVGSDYDLKDWHRGKRIMSGRTEEPPTPEPGPAPALAGADEPGKQPVAQDEEKKFFGKVLAKPDLSKVKEIVAAGEAWSVKPDGRDPNSLGQSAPIQVKSTQSKNFLLSGKRAIIVSGNDKESGIERVNFGTSATDGTSYFEKGSLPIALSPDAKKIVARSDGFFPHEKGRLDLWSIDGEPKHIVSYEPYRRSKEEITGIKWADFSDEEHYLSLSTTGELICWETASPVAIWRSQLDNGASCVLSPGRKYVYAVTAEGLLCFDSKTGKVLSSASGNAPDGVVSVSDDGKRLAVRGDRTLAAWKLDDGSFLGEVGLPTDLKGKSIACLNDGFAMVGSTLFDLDQRAPVWQYALPATRDESQVFGLGDRLWAIFSKGNALILASQKIPHEAARKAANSFNAENAFVLQPGGKLTLDASFEGTDDQKKKIIDNITRRLAASNISIADGQPVRLVLRTETGKTAQQTYGDWRRGPFSRDGETVNVTEKITRASLEVDGKIVWEARSVSGGGGMISRKEGQSLQDAVNASIQYNHRLLENIRLPQYFLKSLESLKLSRSNWQLSGIKDE